MSIWNKIKGDLIGKHLETGRGNYIFTDFQEKKSYIFKCDYVKYFDWKSDKYEITIYKNTKTLLGPKFLSNVRYCLHELVLENGEVVNNIDEINQDIKILDYLEEDFKTPLDKHVVYTKDDNKEPTNRFSKVISEKERIELEIKLLEKRLELIKLGGN